MNTDDIKQYICAILEEADKAGDKLAFDVSRPPIEGMPVAGIRTWELGPRTHISIVIQHACTAAIDAFDTNEPVNPPGFAQLTETYKRIRDAADAIAPEPPALPGPENKVKWREFL